MIFLDPRQEDILGKFNDMVVNTSEYKKFNVQVGMNNVVKDRYKSLLSNFREN